MFNKMSSLCCAIATPDRSLPCHRCAILGISSLFHANASEAKPCRCESLRCTTFPLQITSALFSAIPSRRHALLRLCLACLCFSVPLHSSSPHSRCHAPLSLALPLQLNAELFRCNSAPCFATPCLAIQFLRHASPYHASANQGRQCHALALRPSPHRRCK